MVPAVSFEVLDTLHYRKDEHHRDDGHCTESLERERHIKFILSSGSAASYTLDKIRLNLFKSRPSFNIFPQNPVDHACDRHFCLYLFVYQMNTLTGVIPLRDHVQFQLGCLDGVPFPDHVPKGPVAAIQ